MKDIARRVWIATAASVVIFAVYESIKTVIYPDMSVITSHVITVIVAGVLTFFVSRYALARYGAAISEIERQTEMTQEMNDLLSGVLETMQEGVLIVDSAMNILLYNTAATRIVKLARKENGEKASDNSPLHLFTSSPLHLFASAPINKNRLVDATRDPVINGAFRRAIEERRGVEERVEMAGRQLRSFQLNVSPLDEDLAVGIFFDITRMERLERIRREFFANLSHELRTPITAILACSETLMAGAMDDRENSGRFIERLHKHAARMSDLIADISDLSAIESGDVKLAPAPVKVASAVTEAIALAESKTAERRVKFQVSVAEDLCVMADPVRLEQILSNLIDNAIKFNKPDGTVTVSAERRGAEAVISVEDTGAGISSQDLPRIFERLYRADKSRSRRVEGTGLGLAIVKHLVQAQGGEVFAASELGQGSRMTFTLPLADAAMLESRDDKKLTGISLDA
jgi:two-component system phosphate regulon sensor histidine kinase PhoR